MKTTMINLWRRNSCQRRCAATLLLACFLPTTALALPTAPQVISGSAAINTSGNTMTISNSANTIINWQGFSIGQGEITRFIQPSSDSAILNRVTGGDPSAILGALQSNGRVLLINPNGILFGANARVDVGGLIASSLNLRNEEFLAGKMNFTAGSVAGKIENQGTITLPGGGSVYLLAPDVTNSGIISAPNGNIMLAAGKEVLLVDAYNPEIAVVASAPEHRAINLGSLVADAGRIGMYGGVVLQKGMISADSAVRDAGGRVFLKASREVSLAEGSRTSANGKNGGNVTVQASEGTTLVSGTIEATGSAGKGGTVQILGQRVGLIDNGAVDANGSFGGGTVLIGGDYRGKNPDLQNAMAAYIGKETTISADATTSGDGGKVIVWSDDVTRAYGSISARGGASGGDGGFVETSGGYLDVNGIKVNSTASKGKGGTWLLDPYSIDITAATSNATSTATQAGLTWSANASPSTIDGSVIESALNGGQSVIIDTAGAGADAGDITLSYVMTGLASAAASTLTLNAHNDIRINAAIGGNLNTIVLQADQDANGAGSVFINQPVQSSIFNAAGNNISVAATGAIQSDNITLTAIGAVSVNNAVTLGPSQLNITSGTGVYGSTPADPLRTNYLDGSLLLSVNNTGAGPIRIADSSNSGLLVSGSGVIQSGVGEPVSISSNPSVSGALTISGPVTSSSGNILLSASGTNVPLAINSAVTATSGNVTYIADNIGLTAMTNAAAAGKHIEVQPFTPGTNIEFSANADAAGILRLSGTELAYINTPQLKVGNSSMTGNITLLEPVNPAGFSSLSLTTGGTIIQTNGNTITIAGLNADGWGGVSLNEANAITNLGGHTDSGNFQFTDINGINVALVDGNNGITVSNAGNIALIAGSNVTQSGSAVLAAPGTLSVSSATGINLPNANAVPGVSLSNTTATAITYNASSAPLAVSAANTAAGNISISSAGPLTVDNAVSGSGAIALTASGAVTLVTATTSGAVTVTSTGGAIVDSNAGTLNITGGTVTLNAATGIATDVTATTSVAAQTTAGNITLTSPGNMPLGVISTPGTVSLTSSGGNLSSAIGSTNITAAQVLLSAQTGIGSALTPLKTGVSTLSAINGVGIGAMGNINIVNSGALTTATVTNYDATFNPNGKVSITAQSPLTIGSPLTAGGDIALKAGSTGPGVLTDILTINGVVTSYNGNISLSAGNQIIENAAVTPGNGKTVTRSANLNSPPSCSSGYLWNGSACVAITCSAGYQLIGSFCEPTISTCTATPSLPGCSVVLPSLATCTSVPTTSGCSAVLPSVDACTVTPTLPGCSVVLPSISTCTVTPSLPGCSVVLPSVDACILTPTRPGCSIVLPNIAACVAVPTLPGCSVVLPNISACVAVPTLPGCSVVLPNISACLAVPTLPGCSVVLPNISACLAAPALPGCSIVLPNLTACIATPTLPGCSVVLPNLTACIATPTLPGCSVVLPNLTACIATPTLPGCSVVLPNLSVCVATPSLSGCSVVLPSLSACAANPAQLGCAAVLPTLAQCITNPALAGCSTVLPTLAQCVASPALAGCSTVLPTLAQCITNPALAGCSTVLPTLAQCSASPTLAGCAVVLPPVSQCTIDPTSAGCQVVLPSTQTQSNQPVSQVVNATINLINTPPYVSPGPVAAIHTPMPPTPPQKPTSTDAKAPPDSQSPTKKEDKKEDKNEDKSNTAAIKDNGAKKDEPVRKLYCN